MRVLLLQVMLLMILLPVSGMSQEVKIQGAGHFLQEQKGEEWARLIIDFMRVNPI